jgi:hypothetical protein
MQSQGAKQPALCVTRPLPLPAISLTSPARIIFAFRQYARCTEHEIQRWEHNYRALSARHRALLAHLPAKATAARRAVQQNQMFIKALLMEIAGTDEGEQQQQQQQQGGAAGASSDAAAAAGAAGSSGNAEDGGGGVPGDLAAGALRFANRMEAQQQQCGPADAEKVGG